MPEPVFVAGFARCRAVAQHPVDTASLRAIEKTAVHPLWRALRRKAAPRAVLECFRETAAIRRTPATRVEPVPSASCGGEKAVCPPPSGRGRPQSAGSEHFGADAVDARQVDPAKRHSSVRTLCRPRRRIAFSLIALGWVGTGWSRFSPVGDFLQDACRIGRDLALSHVVELQRRLEVEQMLPRQLPLRCSANSRLDFLHRRSIGPGPVLRRQSPARSPSPSDRSDR